jgi:hypothetical protein
MAGVKGKSGRRSTYHDVRIAELGGLSVAWAINNWNDLSVEQKLKIVITVGARFVPQELKHSGEVDINILIETLQKARLRADPRNEIFIDEVTVN